MDVPKSLDCTLVDEQDLVSRYIGRKLSPEEAETFEEHYFGCERCWGEVKAGAEVRASLAPASSIRSRWRPFAIAAAIAFVAFGAALIVSRTGRRAGVGRIARSVTSLPYSHLQARLAGPFEALPPDTAFRGEDGPGELDLKAAALRAKQVARDRPSAEAHHAAGVGSLLLGEYDDAIVSLVEASREKNESDISTDLVAAYLARAHQRRARRETAGALEDVDAALKALRNAPDAQQHSLAALFNRALVLEASGLRREAAEAWKRYVERDPKSRWAAEAKAHLEALSQEPQSRLWEKERNRLERAALEGDQRTVREIVSRFHQPARLMVEDELLPGWGKAAISGQTEAADRNLRAARELGAALEERGDFLIGDSIAAIHEARGASLEALRNGHTTYGLARALYKKRAIREAIALFQRARTELAESPFSGLGTLALASCAYFESALERCSRILDELDRMPRAEKLRYPSLAAQSRWVRGLVQESRGQFSDAADSYGSALDVFTRLDETGNVATLNVMLAENLRYLGERSRAWNHRLDALVLMDRLGSSTKLPPALGEAERAAMRDGQLELALAFGNAQVESATALGDDVLTAEAHYERSLVHAARGNRPASRADLGEAREWCGRISEVTVRDRMTANIDAAEGETLAATEPGRAVEAFGNALRFFRSRQHHFRAADLLLRRGRLYESRPDTDLAVRDYLEGIRELESERAGVREEGYRISHFETAADLFDEAIGLLARRGEFSRAFDYSERKRARALLDTAGGLAGSIPRGSPLTSALLPAAIPESVALLEYVVLDDRLLLWAIVREGVRFVSVDVGRPRLEQLAKEIHGSLVRKSSQGDTAASELYSVLIRPAQEALRNADTLIIVPDGALHIVPFAALTDSSGRYLIERYRIGVAPSATIYVNCLARDRALNSSTRQELLAIGNPAVDPLRFGKLPDLAAAGREAVRVASYYPGSETLTGKDATPRQFLHMAPRFDLIHFAGHAIVDPRSPALSGLILAPDPETSESGALHANRISLQRLGRVRLVILAACSTGEGQTLGTEGVLSLARAFLAAGVPAVVASLGLVQDFEASSLFEVFHKRLRKGDDAMTALREAQLTELSSTETPSSWATFTVFGGVRHRKEVRDAS